MQITINNIPIEVLPDETLIEVARRAGHAIPSLCYAKGAQHKSSCMVCAVKNAANGQIIPSCTTRPTEGMQIETDSEEVNLVRSLSLELLLSDHRADCEAPCSMVCPKGLDVERMLQYYDAGEHEMAFQCVVSVIARQPAAEAIQYLCDGCKAPCEKACRRGTVDKAVSIREIIKGLPSSPGLKATPPEGGHDAARLSSLGGGARLRAEEDLKTKEPLKPFQSRLGRFTDKEKQRLQATVTAPSRCLHCACAGRSDCKLRLYATTEGIKRTRYNASSALPAMNKQHVTGNLWFEQAKCIRCGLCVYNSNNGFTFKDRGFGMQVVIPEENRANVNEDLAGLCPTGAIYITKGV